jgi:putative zinc finger/helix-turn-helix YgiT family protein
MNENTLDIQTPSQTQETYLCPNCGAKDIRTTWIEDPFPYGVGVEPVQLTARVPLRTCAACGCEYYDEDAEDARHEAICRHLGVQTPAEIAALRKKYGLSRAEFARLTKLGEATIARWERGALIQNAANDRFLSLLRWQENLDRLRNLEDCCKGEKKVITGGDLGSRQLIADNLFGSLFRWAHRQDENFLTESLVFLARHLLRQEPATGAKFLGWLCFGQESSHPFEHVTTVSTQISTEGGRPDVRIESCEALCLLEVKKESPLGECQLERYRTVLNQSPRAIKQLALLTIYAMPFENGAEKPDRQIRWFQVASWLQRQEFRDPVSCFLVEQFLDFLRSEVTTVEQVSRDYLNGVVALQNLVGMIGKALENLPNPRPKSIWKSIGYYLDGGRFWAGVLYQWPNLVCFGFTDVRIADVEKFRKLLEPALKHGPVLWDDKYGPHFMLNLDSEPSHFFSLSADSQLALLKDFFEEAYRVCKKLIAAQE